VLSLNVAALSWVKDSQVTTVTILTPN
jgi:hypothetical protein